METVSAPLVAIEGIQNQWRARTRRKTDYSFLEERDLTRSEVTAGMGSIGTALYLGAAEITSQLTLGVMTLGQDKVLAGAMGIMYMDAMQHRKEREGVDELKAADTALLTGMADYCLGRLGYGSISRCVEEGVRKSLVRKMGESFLTGAGMALGSETGGQLIDWMLNGRLSEWGKIYNAHLDEGMSETEAFGEMVKDVGPELTAHTVAGGISGAGFAVIHMLAASKDNHPRKQETIEKTNQGGERNRNETRVVNILFSHMKMLKTSLLMPYMVRIMRMQSYWENMGMVVRRHIQALPKIWMRNISNLIIGMSFQLVILKMNFGKLMKSFWISRQVLGEKYTYRIIQKNI